MRAGGFNLPDYDFRLTKMDGEHPVVLVVDRDLGNMSVTNGIEHVLKATDPADCAEAFYYRDSALQWDEVAFDEENGFVEFVPLSDKMRKRLETKWRELVS